MRQSLPQVHPQREAVPLGGSSGGGAAGAGRHAGQERQQGAAALQEELRHEDHGQGRRGRGDR